MKQKNYADDGKGGVGKHGYCHLKQSLFDIYAYRPKMLSQCVFTNFLEHIFLLIVTPDLDIMLKPI